MMEFTKYGKVYVPEKYVNYADIKSERYSKTASDFLLGALLVGVMIVCPFIGLFI